MERTVVVRLAEGLHARPAALFVKAAGTATVPVMLSRPGGTPVPASSILSVLLLDVSAGDQVVLSTTQDSVEAEGTLDALSAFLSQEVPAHDGAPAA